MCVDVYMICAHSIGQVIFEDMKFQGLKEYCGLIFGDKNDS